MSTTQGIKLDEQIQKRLKTLAAQRDRSPHWLMRTAVEDYLEREERIELEKAEDTARWEQYQLTGEAVDGVVVENWLGDLSKNKVTPWPQ